MDDDTLTPTRLVEAALFTAGRPVSVDEIVEATGLDVKSAKRALKALEMEYDERGDGTALEVGQAGEKWAMQLRTRYVQHARLLAEMEIPKKLLKTLALIAFHQPLLQSELVEMVGTKAYDHVRELTEIGLVKARAEGVSKRLTSSPSFPEYFGIPATDTHEIRTFLAKKVGLTLKTPTGEAQLESFGTIRNALAPFHRPVVHPDAIVAAAPRGRVARAAAEAEADADDLRDEAAAVTIDVRGEATV